MDDIIKYDVRTYVEELIKKDLPSKNNEEKVLSDKEFREQWNVKPGKTPCYTSGDRTR
jgi:hypothetical protein